MKTTNPMGLYFHVPFCHARCGYCDFVTFTGKEDRIDQYVEDLCKEIRLYVGAGHRPRPLSDRISGRPGDLPLQWNISTIFFGGGTPSLLERHHVSQILDTVRSAFMLDPAAEITLEANPESLSAAKAAGWRKSGVNRLSIGLQAYDNALLRAMDRLHTVEEFLSAYQMARAAGFENISVDLIYGFPGQTLESWQETVKSTAALSPEHLSLYALKVEEHTPFHNQGITVNDDRQAEMYEWARAQLNTFGYPQYEISNFARSGRECRHNLIYWRQQNYLGLGVGAVGCVNSLRWENRKSLMEYHRDLQEGKLPRATLENLSPVTRRFERLMLGLRLREGLDWKECDPEWRLRRAELASRRLLEEVSPDRWRIPDWAVAMTNQVLVPFVP